MTSISGYWNRVSFHHPRDTAITCCSNTTSDPSPFSKLVKGNGAPHANSVKLHAVLNYPLEIC